MAKKASNASLLIMILSAVFLMVALAFASVPLYRLFCQVTGYGGTPQISEEAPPIVLERTVKVEFNADTDPNLDWEFHANEREIEVRIGAMAFTSYTAKNTTSEPIRGMATYNVTPLKVGKYFHKVACFCFEEQVLQPGQEMEMPVQFFIDPEIARDDNMDDVKEMTLSYTFFKVKKD